MSNIWMVVRGAIICMEHPQNAHYSPPHFTGLNGLRFYLIKHKDNTLDVGPPE